MHCLSVIVSVCYNDQLFYTFYHSYRTAITRDNSVWLDPRLQPASTLSVAVNLMKQQACCYLVRSNTCYVKYPSELMLQLYLTV